MTQLLNYSGHIGYPIVTTHFLIFLVHPARDSTFYNALARMKQCNQGKSTSFLPHQEI